MRFLFVLAALKVREKDFPNLRARVKAIRSMRARVIRSDFLSLRARARATLSLRAIRSHSLKLTANLRAKDFPSLRVRAKVTLNSMAKATLIPKDSHSMKVRAILKNSVKVLP